MSGHILVHSLMDGKEAEQVGEGSVGGSAILTLPVEGSKVVSFGQDGTLLDIEVLSNNVKVDEPPSEL